MRIQDASSEIIDMSGNLCQDIERAGRLAYKSEDKITDESAPKFVKKMISDKHMPVIEFGIVHVIMTLPFALFDEWYNLRGVNDAKYIQITRMGRGSVGDKVDILITGSVRGLSDYLLAAERLHSVTDNIANFLYTEDKVAFGSLKVDRPVDHDMIFSRIHDEELYDFCDDGDPELSDISITTAEYAKHKHVMVRFVCNRAVTHEIVRHRPCSYLQESQRYCRYSEDKFGKVVTFINPKAFFTYESDPVAFTAWNDACRQAESQYMFILTERKQSPQAARTVLPNSCKTEILMLCNLEEWRHFFNMRVPKSAEPSMRELTIPLHKEMVGRFPELNNL